MSRRSVLKRKILGFPGSSQSKHEDKGSQCKGDKSKFNSTRPSGTVKGTGAWLGKGDGVGEIVTLGEK